MTSVTADIEKNITEIQDKRKSCCIKEVRKYMELEDGKSDLSFVETSNVLKRKSNETKQEI